MSVWIPHHVITGALTMKEVLCVHVMMDLYLTVMDDFVFVSDLVACSVPLCITKDC